MRLKKLVTGLLAFSMLFSMSSIALADANASWNAAKGTASVDGQKDDVYANAQEMKMEAVSDGTADGTAASAWAVYDAEAFYVFVEVTDSKLDDAAANVYEKDSVEFRLDTKEALVQAYAVSETFDGTFASEVKVVKTDKGYNTEFKVPYATSDGGKALFSLQVNAASDGKRNCTLHTNDDLKNVWQDASVLETLVFNADSSAATAATTTATPATSTPKTGVVSAAVLLGLGAAATGTGAVCFKKKK